MTMAFDDNLIFVVRSLVWLPCSSATRSLFPSLVIPLSLSVKKMIEDFFLEMFQPFAYPRSELGSCQPTYRG